MNVRRTGIVVFSVLMSIAFFAAGAYAQGSADWSFAVAVKAAAEKLSPAVVSVETRFDQPRTDPDYQLWDYFRGNRPTYGLYGSGFFYRGKYVITTDAITDNYAYGRVVLTDGRSYSAKYLGKNETFHVAVLEVDLPPGMRIPEPQFFDSDKLKLGQPIAVIGRSLNSKDTFATAGVISAIRKQTVGSETPTEEFIQFDANFELTFIGGPLSDIEGKIVAMVHWTSGINVNIAVPINDVLMAADKIIAGDTRVPWFGADMIERTTNIDIIYKLGNLSFEDGLFVTYVQQNSPADFAGILSGDVIETIKGRRFSYMSEYSMLRRRFFIGEQVPVKYWRNGKSYEVVVTILPTPESLAEGGAGASSPSSSGMPPGHP